MAVETPASGAVVTAPFEVAGWALDEDATTLTGIDAIHVYAFPSGGGSPTFLGVGTYGVARPEVGAAFGAQFTNTGYTLVASLPAGTFTVVVYARSTVTGIFSAAVRTITVRDAAVTTRVSPARETAGASTGSWRSLGPTAFGGPVSVVSPDPAWVSELIWYGRTLVAATRGRGLLVNDLGQLQMSLEAPSGGGSLTPPFTVSGWALDQRATTGAGVDAIHVYAFPSGGGATFLGVASYGQSRSDVGAAFGSQFTNSGFSLTVSSLAAGAYRIVAYAHSTVTGTFDIATSASVTVVRPTSAPRAAIGAPAADATVAPSFYVAGWAVDLGASSGPGIDAIHVYAYPTAGGGPVFLGAASYGGSRPDVGAVFGSRFTNSGFGLSATLPSGKYTLVVFYRSTVSGSFSSVVRAITVRQPGNPLMSIDRPGTGTTTGRPFPVAGWAIDLDSAAGTGVDAIHVWAFPVGGGSPVFLGVAGYGGVRGDVGAIFGSRFTNSGYNLVVSSLPAGTYQIAVYAHSAVTGTFNQARAVTVTVQ
ncbi:MAG: hypothetical protein A3H96_04845 [Acidobacteria bacterium RIFCSPLOWO2_02_FULL_67_36]|nr:MAG: hypothetical protein A3H96_04845 [Acidobacteria bacterium RIFCSPLOWO2_02_FULL_67_36]